MGIWSWRNEVEGKNLREKRLIVISIINRNIAARLSFGLSGLRLWKFQCGNRAAAPAGWTPFECQSSRWSLADDKIWIFIIYDNFSAAARERRTFFSKTIRPVRFESNYFWLANHESSFSVHTHLLTFFSCSLKLPLYLQDAWRALAELMGALELERRSGQESSCEFRLAAAVCLVRCKAQKS